MRSILVLLLASLVVLVGANSIEDAHEFLDSLELPNLCLEECPPQSDVVVRHACTCVRPTPALGLYENFTCVSTFNVENLSEQPLLATPSIGPQRLIIEVTRRVETFDPNSETREAYVVEWRCQGGASSLEVALRGNNGVVDSTTASGFAVSGVSTTALALCDGTRCGVAMRCPVGHRSYLDDIDYAPSVRASAVRYDQLCVAAQSSSLNYLPSMLDPSVNVSADPEALYYDAVCGGFADDPLLPLGSVRLASGARQVFGELRRNVMSLAQSELYLGAIEDETDIERRQVRLIMQQCMTASELPADALTVSLWRRGAQAGYERFVAACKDHGFARAFARSITLESYVVGSKMSFQFPITTLLYRGTFGASSEIFVSFTAYRPSIDPIVAYLGATPGSDRYYAFMNLGFEFAGIPEIEWDSRQQDYVETMALLEPLHVKWLDAVLQAEEDVGVIEDVISGETLNNQLSLLKNYTFEEAQLAAGAFELADFLSELLGESVTQRDFASVRFTTIGGGLSLLNALAGLAADVDSRRRFEAYVAVESAYRALIMARDFATYLVTPAGTTARDGAPQWRYKTALESERFFETRLQELIRPDLPAPGWRVSHELPLVEIPPGVLASSRRDVTPEDGPQVLAAPIFSIDGSTAAVVQCASYLVLETRFSPWIANPLVRRLNESHYFAHIEDEMFPRVRDAMRKILVRAHAQGFMSDARFEGDVQRLASISMQLFLPIIKFPRLDTVPLYDDLVSNALYSISYYTQASVRGIFDEHYRAANTENVFNPLGLNAFTVPDSLYIAFLLGFVLPPHFYGPSVDLDSLNGEMGSLIETLAHELSHSFASVAQQYPPEGGTRNWMQPSDLDLLRQEGACFRAFYAAAVSRYGVSQQNEVYEEAMADYWGTRVALEIMNARHAEQNVTGAARRAELQRLFIAGSQQWCGRTNAVLEQIDVETRVHPLNEFRARLGPLLFDEFWEAWGVARPAHIPNCTIMGQ